MAGDIDPFGLKMVYCIYMGDKMLEINEMTQIAEVVRKTRKKQKVSQTILSQASNVGLRFVGDIERGKPSVQFDKLLAVLTTLGISLKLELPQE